MNTIETDRYQAQIRSDTEELAERYRRARHVNAQVAQEADRTRDQRLADREETLRERAVEYLMRVSGNAFNPGASQAHEDYLVMHIGLGRTEAQQLIRLQERHLGVGKTLGAEANFFKAHQDAELAKALAKAKREEAIAALTRLISAQSVVKKCRAELAELLHERAVVATDIEASRAPARLRMARYGGGSSRFDNTRSLSGSRVAAEEHVADLDVMIADVAAELKREEAALSEFETVETVDAGAN